MALGQRALGRRSWFLLALGVIGASMFLGNSMITPAISVLSAVEGLKLARPRWSIRRAADRPDPGRSVRGAEQGTAMVASAFGPVMVVWFAAGGAGRHSHRRRSEVLAAINPLYAVEFLLSHGTIGLVTLGAVFLAVTGGEALYADLGHFGRKPIQPAWMLLRTAVAARQLFRAGRADAVRSGGDRKPFYRMVPEVCCCRWSCLPPLQLSSQARR